MAHPHSEHRAHKHEKARVQHIAGMSGGEPKHYARGGSVHSDEAEDKALITKSVKKSCMRADGGSVKARADKAPRRARGGHVKGHKGAKTNVNVIVAPSGGPKGPMAGMMPPPPPAAGAMPPPMPPKPPMAPPPMPVGMAGPPGPGAGGIPMRKRGGAVDGKKSMADHRGVTGIGARTPIQHSGNKGDTQNIGRGPVITRATGGKTEAYGAKMSPTFPHKAGAGSGVARKAKAHMGSARHGMVP